MVCLTRCITTISQPVCDIIQIGARYQVLWIYTSGVIAGMPDTFRPVPVVVVEYSSVKVHTARAAIHHSACMTVTLNATLLAVVNTRH